MVIKNGKILGLLLLWIGTVQAQFCEPESITASTPDSQLIDNGDGTITDSMTGLMWKRCSEGQSGNDCAAGSAEFFSWSQALQRAQTLNNSSGFAGHRDWRVPNIKELWSLVELQCGQPAINLTRFPNTLYAGVGTWYISSSSLDGNGVWGISFDDTAHMSFFDKNIYPGLLRLVRSVSYGPGIELIDDGTRTEPSDVDTTPAGTPIQPVSSEPLPAQRTVSNSAETDALPTNPAVGNFN